MAQANHDPSRLCLVTPLGSDPATLAPRVAEALSGGNVASLIIADDPSHPAALEPTAALVAIAQAQGVAAIVHGDPGVVARTGADGIHVDGTGADLAAAVERFGGSKIVGAGGLKSRHDAILAGEAGADYLFFGRLDGDTGDGVFDKALDLAAWWSSVTVVPAIVMGGRILSSVAAAADAGIAFVALSRAVWDDPRGPAAAVAEASAYLAAIREPAA